jgi:hypothetical protein
MATFEAKGVCLVDSFQFRYIEERVFTANERDLTNLDASSWCWARWPGAG